MTWSRELIYLLIIFLFFTSCKNDHTKTVSTADLIDSIEYLNIQVDSISKTNIDIGGEMDYWQLSGKNYILLKQNGIRSPNVFLSNDLSTKSYLIPFKPTLGGKMEFTRIALLGSHWAIAHVEDGHIGGEILVSYKLVGDSVRWLVLDTALSD